MDIFVEQWIEMIVNKENINQQHQKNQENQQTQQQQKQKQKVIFHIGPDKKNAYKSLEFTRWEN